MKIKLHTTDPLAFVKRAYFLCYQACGGALGMGVFQAFRDVGEADVFKSVEEQLDYGGPSEHDKERAKRGDYYADYVFGRMIKLGLKIDGDTVTTTGREEWDPEYQGFSTVYPNFESLAKATLGSLGEREDTYTVL